MNMNWPLGGRAPSLLVIHSAFLLLFVLFFLIEDVETSDLMWRTVLCAFHVETNVDQGGFFDFCLVFWEGGREIFFLSFSFFLSLLARSKRLRRGHHPPSASINLWRPSSVQTPVLSPSQITSQQLACSAYHLTWPLPVLCVCVCVRLCVCVLGEGETSSRFKWIAAFRCWGNALCMWCFNETGPWDGNSSIWGNMRVRGVVCYLLGLGLLCKSEASLKGIVWHFWEMCLFTGLQ